jgi:hypothetical protein
MQLVEVIPAVQTRVSLTDEIQSISNLATHIYELEHLL